MSSPLPTPIFGILLSPFFRCELVEAEQGCAGCGRSDGFGGCSKCVLLRMQNVSQKLRNIELPHAAYRIRTHQATLSDWFRLKNLAVVYGHANHRPRSTAGCRRRIRLLLRMNDYFPVYLAQKRILKLAKGSGR